MDLMIVSLTLFCLSISHAGVLAHCDSNNCPQFSQHMQQCIDQLKLDASVFQNDVQKDFLDHITERNNSDAKCFLRCMFTNLGILNEQDEIQTDVVERMMHFYDGESVDLDRCKQIRMENKCDQAVAIRKCFYEEQAKQRDFDKYWDVAQACVEEQHLDLSRGNVAKLIVSIESKNATEPVDRSTQCLWACILRKLGYFTDEGELVVSLVLDVMKGLTAEVAEKCRTVKGDDGCASVILVRNCIMEESAKRNV